MMDIDASTGFAAVFLIGVALGVYVTVRGVERRTGRRSLPAVDDFGRVTASGRIALGAPLLASSLTVFGLAGYLAARVGGLPASGAAGLGVVFAAAATPLAIHLVRRWARRAATDDAPDPRYALQGHLARVISWTREGPGEIEYTANGRRVVAPAHSLDRTPLVPGEDVVIDRLEDGVVYVESWTRVEERL
jgi:membrane protein implicated in regulation of membrane protease activity